MDSRDHKDGFQFSRVLSRESSAGQSSRIYYRRAEGVPFQWEMQPGTPKNPPKEEDVIPPLSPPPSLQSLGLPKPCFDTDHEHQESNHLKVRIWKKIKKLHQLKIFGKSHQNSEIMHGSFVNRLGESDGEFVANSFKNSSSSFSSSSSTDSFASSRQGRENPARIRSRDMMEDKYSCCTPWNVTALEKDDANHNYSKMNKKAFSSSQESDQSFFQSRILSRMSSVDKSASHSYYRSTEGIPFNWEMQPGKPLNPPENGVNIPPPSPPPMVQSSLLPKPSINIDQYEETKRSTWERIWHLIKTKRMIKKENTIIKQRERIINNNELSFRLESNLDHFNCNGKLRGTDNSHGDSVLLTSSSSSISKKKVLPLSKFRKDVLGGNVCFNPWKIKANLAASSSRRI